jgi:hypothetical protein
LTGTAPPLARAAARAGGGGGPPRPGRVDIGFADDLARVVGHVTYPDPALPAAHASQPSHRVYPATNREAILRDLINTQCGSAALAVRQIPKLALGALAGVGGTTTWRTRWQPLGDALREVALGDGLGFRVRQAAGELLFEVYEPADLTGVARFSLDLGNLRAVSNPPQAPTLTHALVAGGDEGADRTIVEVADEGAAAEWWRIEAIIDRRDVYDDTDGELTQAGQEALAEGAQPVELHTVTVDTPDLQAGRDFRLGDRVTVALTPDLEVADTVRSIHLQATPGAGEHVTTTVGSPEASTETHMIRLVRDLSRRLGRLEAR